jgi:hypothetical protein
VLGKEFRKKDDRKELKTNNLNVVAIGQTNKGVGKGIQEKR